MATIIAALMIPIPFTGMSVIWWLAIPALLLVAFVILSLLAALVAILFRQPSDQ
jgi:hypothetical protein